MRVTGDYWKDGYASVQELLPREAAGQLLFIVRDRIAQHGSIDLVTNHASVVDDQVVQLHSRLCTPLDTLAWGMTPAISQIVGRELLPTYAYFRIYRKGQFCFVHSDRPACEISLSLTLAYSDDKVWPLEVAKAPCPENNTEIVREWNEPYGAIQMQPGDGVIYQGVTRNHGRMTPNPNEWSAHLFTHWVDRNGPQAEKAFDGRMRFGKVDFSMQERAPAQNPFFIGKL